MAELDVGMSGEAPLKHFSLEEATNALPYVRRIVGDIVEEYARWKESISKYELLAADSKAQEGETDAQVALRGHVDTIALRINSFVQELAQVGCVFKGFDDGLVDFQSTLDGRDIYLCWKLGEPEIRYWHEIDSGFASRQALENSFVDGGSN